MPQIELSRGRALVTAALLLVALLLAGRLLLHAGTPHAASPPIHLATAAPAVPELLVVDVVGAVRRPGLLRLAKGSRIADAVARAGGATRRADLAQVNLAAPIADGEQVVVPTRGAAGPTGTAAATPPAGPVHLSTATAEQLDGLPGIGPSLLSRVKRRLSTLGMMRASPKEVGAMWIRIARFEGADPDSHDPRAEMIRSRLRDDASTTGGNEVPQVKRVLMLADREGGRWAGVQFAETEDDIRRFDEFLQRQTPPPGSGTQSSVEIYEVLLDEEGT